MPSSSAFPFSSSSSTAAGLLDPLSASLKSHPSQHPLYSKEDYESKKKRRVNPVVTSLSLIGGHATGEAKEWTPPSWSKGEKVRWADTVGGLDPFSPTGNSSNSGSSGSSREPSPFLTPTTSGNREFSLGTEDDLAAALGMDMDDEDPFGEAFREEEDEPSALPGGASSIFFSNSSARPTVSATRQFRKVKSEPNYYRPRKNPSSTSALYDSASDDDDGSDKVSWHDTITKAWEGAFNKSEVAISLENRGLVRVPPEVSDLGLFTSLHSSTSSSSSTSSTSKVSLHMFLSRNLLTISSFPAEFWSLQNLTVLSLRDNLLDEVPVGIGSLKGLKELNLSGNRLRYLPSEILSLNLDVLTIHPNPFIPPTSFSVHLPPISNGQIKERILGPLSISSSTSKVPSLVELATRALLKPTIPPRRFSKSSSGASSLFSSSVGRRGRGPMRVINTYEGTDSLEDLKAIDHLIAPFRRTLGLPMNSTLGNSSNVKSGISGGSGSDWGSRRGSTSSYGFSSYDSTTTTSSRRISSLFDGDESNGREGQGQECTMMDVTEPWVCRSPACVSRRRRHRREGDEEEGEEGSWCFRPEEERLEWRMEIAGVDAGMSVSVEVPRTPSASASGSSPSPAQQSGPFSTTAAAAPRRTFQKSKSTNSPFSSNHPSSSSTTAAGSGMNLKERQRQLYESGQMGFEEAGMVARMEERAGGSGSAAAGVEEVVVMVGVPVLWRGCCRGCLDFLVRED